MTINEYVANFNFKTKPYKHQIEFLKYGLYNNRFLLLDEQGMGKTKECIDLAIAYKDLYNYKHCLIICGVSSLRYNWLREIEIHSDEKGYILGQYINKHNEINVGSINDRLTDLNVLLNGGQLPYFLIINVETLRNVEFTTKLKECLDNNLIEMILCDEIHRVKNSSSKQGKAFLTLKTETMIGMTGTLILNNPLECYVPLAWLGYEKHNYYQFEHFYCVFGGNFKHQILRYKHIDVLKDMINKCSIRRLRKDYLDLPPKIRINEYLEMTENQKRIYNDVLRAIKDEIDLILVSNNPLARLTRLRQATSTTSILSSTINESIKLDRVEELVEDLNSSSKVIIFSNFIETCNEVYKRLSKYNPAIYTGQTVDFIQQEEKFHKDNSCRVIIGTISKMGTGLTLTEANTIIFIDEPWTRAIKDQAEDRAYRIGTKSDLTIITLLCANTIDEKINNLITQKGQIADFVVDNKEPEKAKNLFKYLLDL